MSGVLKAVGSVVSSAVSWVGDAISSVADFVVDGILSPIADFAGGFIDGFLENPFTSIAKIAAAVSGQPWVIALVNGAATAIEGGGLGDVLLATAGSYISSSLGSQFNSFIGGAGSALTDNITGPELFISSQPTNFVSEALSNTFVKEIVGSGVSGAANAIIYGEDPVEAFLKGGVTAGISAGLGQIQDYLGFDTLTSTLPGSADLEGIVFQDSASFTDTVLNVVGAGMQSFLAEGEITPEAMANAVTRGFITSDVVADLAGSLGVGYFEDPAALAYTTAAVQRVVGTALSGGSGQQAYAALESTLDAYGSVKFKEVLDNFNIQEVIGKTLDVLSGNYDDVETAATNYNTIGLRRQGDAKEYEDKRLELQTELDAINAEKTRIQGLPTKTAAQQSAYNAAVRALNTRISDWVKLRDQYQPRMNVLAENIKRDTELLATAKTDLETAYGALYSTTDTLDTELKPLNDGFLEAITLTMDPVFKEDEYRNINGLSEDENVYEHFLTQGQYEDVYTNYEQFSAAQDRNVSAMMNRVFNEAGIDPSSLDAAAVQEVRSRIVEAYDNPTDIETALNDDELRVRGFIPLQSQYAFESPLSPDDPAYEAPSNSVIFQAQLTSMQDELQRQGLLSPDSGFPEEGINLQDFIAELRSQNLLAPDYTPPGQSEVQTLANELQSAGILPIEYEFEVPLNPDDPAYDSPVNSFTYQTYLNSIQNELQSQGFLPSDYAPSTPKNDVQTLADELQQYLGTREENPYRDATLTPEIRARLEALGFDTEGGDDGGELLPEEKAALYAQDNQGQSTAGLAPGTTWEDVAAGKAVVQYDEDGNRSWNLADLVSATETRWDPNYGLVNVITEYDSQGRPVYTQGFDSDGIEIEEYRQISIYGTNSSETFLDSLYGLSQGGATRQQIADTLDNHGVLQKASEDLGSEDAAIDFVDRVIAVGNAYVDLGTEFVLNSAGNALRAGGGILEAFNGMVTLAGIAPPDSALSKFAADAIALGSSINTEKYKASTERLNTAMASSSFRDKRTAELISDGLTPTEAAEVAQQEYDALPWYEQSFDKVVSMGGAIADQPLQFIAEYIGVEAVQEVVPVAVGGLTALGAKGVALAFGKQLTAKATAAAGVSGAAVSDLMESYGGAANEGYNQAYDVASRVNNPETGKPFTEEERKQFAINHAIKRGTISAILTGATFKIGGLAWEKAMLGTDEVGGFLSDGINKLQSEFVNGTKIVLREGTAELVEEGVTTGLGTAELARLDPSIDVTGETTAAGFMGFLVGSSVPGGFYGIKQTGDFLANLQATLNPQVNAIVTTTPNTTEGVQSAANALTDLGITGTTQTNLLNNINDAGYTSTQEAQLAFQTANPDYQVTQGELDQFTVAGDEAETSQAVVDYIDPRYVDTQEVIDTAAEQGLTITEEQAAEYVGQQDEASTLEEAAQAYDPLATTAEEAQSAFAEAGYNPTDAETSQFVMEGNEAEILSGIEPYVDPRQVTTEEAQSFFDELGFTPTDEELASFVGQGDENFEATTSDEVGSYVDPRQITEEEVRAAYADAGLEETTQADIDRFIGQFDPETADYDAGDFQSVIESDIGEYLPTASSNILREYVGAPSVADDPNTEIDESRQATGLFAELESAQGAVDQLSTDFDLAIGDTQQQITDLGTDLSEDISGVETALGSQITDLGTDLTADIQSVAELVGKPAQDVTQADIDFVADVIAQNQVLTEQQVTQYDVTGDGIVDINDQTLLEQALGDSTVDLASTSQFASTGIYGQLDTNQQQAMDAIQQLETNQNLTMQQNQEQTMNRLQQIEQSFITNIEDQAMREGGRNFLQMALQAPDAAGQQVSVKTPDPLNLGYIYDFSSIFANPSQQALFPTPYAKGGQVDSTTDRLLQIIGDS